MKNKKSKLSLNKETISSLSNSEMASVKGGFTYSLSLGQTCKDSKALGANRNAYQCGAATKLKSTLGTTSTTPAPIAN